MDDTKFLKFISKHGLREGGISAAAEFSVDLCKQGLLEYDILFSFIAHNYNSLDDLSYYLHRYMQDNDSIDEYDALDVYFEELDKQYNRLNFGEYVILALLEDKNTTDILLENIDFK